MSTGSSSVHSTTRTPMRCAPSTSRSTKTGTRPSRSGTWAYSAVARRRDGLHAGAGGGHERRKGAPAQGRPHARRLGAHPRDPAVPRAGDADALTKVLVLQHLGQRRDRRAVLEVDGEARLGEGLERVGQGGDRLALHPEPAQHGQGLACDRARVRCGHPVERRVVEADEVAVGADPDVGLEVAVAQRGGEAEGGQGVLGRQGGPSAVGEGEGSETRSRRPWRPACRARRPRRRTGNGRWQDCSPDAAATVRPMLRVLSRGAPRIPAEIAAATSSSGPAAPRRTRRSSAAADPRPTARAAAVRPGTATATHRTPTSCSPSSRA